MANISYFKVPQEAKASRSKPCIHIWLSSYSGDRDGDILLSRPLSADAEIDHCVDRLIDQLEQVRRQAKRDLQTAREKRVHQDKRRWRVKRRAAVQP